MPLVKIHLRRGKSAEYLSDLSSAVHQSLVQIANVPADDLFQIIHESVPEHIVAHPSYGGVTRSANLVILEITLNVGRTVEVKKQLYADLAERLQRAIDLRPDDLMVSLVEVTRECWSFGGGRATYA